MGWPVSLLLVAVAALVDGKVRNLRITNDSRAAIAVSHFGFYRGGALDVRLSKFSLPNYRRLSTTEPIGFTFTQGEEALEYVKSPGQCFLLAPPEVKMASPGVYFIMNLADGFVEVHQSLRGIEVDSADARESSSKLPLSSVDNETFSLQFKITFTSTEGYFVFMFHNCRRSSIFDGSKTGPSFSLSLVERNPDTFFSAGDENLPKMYMLFACVFFSYFVAWCYLLRRDKQNAYKIHYLMAAVVVLKSLSVFLHGTNMYYQGIYGEQLEAWAVSYYILHLIKGSLLFATIILIGSGWTLFKNFLVERDRRLLMVIIPLQVLDNIALVIVSESEIGLASYDQWGRIFILFDLLCCAAVILPILWSIKHLEQASQTDGKAVFCLQKLRLFQQFYIIVICYVYLTRVIKYLVQFTIPFKYIWMTTLIEEGGTAIFFLWTGAKFKPAPNNPYLRLAQTEDDEGDYALTQCGAMEDVIFLSKKHKQKDPRDQEATATDEL